MDQTRRNNYEDLTANSNAVINFEVVSLFPTFNHWTANVDGLSGLTVSRLPGYFKLVPVSLSMPLVRGVMFSNCFNAVG